MKLPSNFAKSRGWMLTLVAAAVIVGYVVAVFVPRQKSIGSLSRQLAGKRKVVSAAGLQIASLARIQLQLEKAKSFVQNWQRSSPNDPHLGDVLGKLSTMANQSQVRVSRLSPQDVIVMGVVRQHPLALSVEGEFEHLSEFLAEVETLPESIWIRRLTMKGGREDGNIVECELILTVFADNHELSG